MKQLSKFFAIVSVITGLNACTDYPDEIGIIINRDTREFNYVVTNATYNDYSVNLSAGFTIDDWGTGIEDGGFLIDGTDVKALINQNGNYVTLTADVNNLHFSEYYSVEPYVVSNDIRLFIKRESVHINRDDLKPKASGDLEMYDSHTIKAIATGVMNNDDVTFTFAGFTKTGIDDNKGRKYALFALYDLLPSSSEYSRIEVNVKNLFGESRATIDYRVKVSNVNTAYTNDGDRGDCIRLAGVDWAKGNLVCDNGQWKISNTNNMGSPEINTSSYGEYFSYGNTQLDNVFHSWHGGSNDDIQGMIDYDVVAAHLSGWTLPSYDDFLKLKDEVSVQVCETGVMFSPQSQGKRFYSASGRLPSGGYDVSGALFLPARGVHYSGSESSISYSDIGVYMSSVSDYSDNYCLCFATKSVYNSNVNLSYRYYYGRQSDSYRYTGNSTHKFSVRPVKSH